MIMITVTTTAMITIMEMTNDEMPNDEAMMVSSIGPSLAGSTIILVDIKSVLRDLCGLLFAFLN